MINHDEVYTVIKQHKEDILESCDWWWTVGDYDLNVHCQDDEPYEPDAVFEINLYELNQGATSSYESNVQHNLPPMTRRELRLL